MSPLKNSIDDFCVWIVRRMRANALVFWSQMLSCPLSVLPTLALSKVTGSCRESPTVEKVSVTGAVLCACAEAAASMRQIPASRHRVVAPVIVDVKGRVIWDPPSMVCFETRLFAPTRDPRAPV